MRRRREQRRACCRQVRNRPMRQNAMSSINAFLLKHNLRIATNPCVSPDFCLDWPALRTDLTSGKALKVYPKSRFETKAGAWTLLENEQGDCAWRLEGKSDA